MDFESHVPGREKSQTPDTWDDFFDQLVAFRRHMDHMFDDLFNKFGGRPLAPHARRRPVYLAG